MIRRRWIGLFLLIGLSFFSGITSALPADTENSTYFSTMKSTKSFIPPAEQGVKRVVVGGLNSIPVLPLATKKTPETSLTSQIPVTPLSVTRENTQKPLSSILNKIDIDRAAHSKAQPVSSDQVLHQGNLLSFYFFGNAALTKDFLIDSRGYIELPEAGLIDCKGQTLDSLRQILIKKLSRIYKNTSSLTITKKTNEIYVSVMGMVSKPGLYLIPPAVSLQIALEKAGGISDGAQMNQIQLRRNGKVKIFDYKKYLDTGDDTLLPILSAMDEIFVPSSKLLSDVKLAGQLLSKNEGALATNSSDAVKVFGEVTRPGVFSYNKKLSALDYLLQAGGTTRLAATDQIKLIDNSTTSIFDLRKYLSTGNKRDIPPITAGSIIFVPEAMSSIRSGSATVYVMGQVQKSGAYGMGPKATVLDALASAGGPNQYADGSKLRLIRSSGVVEYFDMQSYIDGEHRGKLPEVKAGDVIYLPGKAGTNERTWLDLPPNHAIKILGAVTRPGRYDWSNDMNLLDLISHVGGTTKDADTAHIRIISNDNTPPVDFNLKQAIEKGVTSSGMPVLKPGYTVYIPEMSQTPFDEIKAVKVFGQVQKTGTYAYNPKYTAIDYLMQAGGVTMYAATDQIKILDNKTALVFNLKEFLDTGKTENMPVISSGATIFVPVVSSEVKKGSTTVYVMGNVQKAGAFELGKKNTFMDVLANAGGPGSAADIRKIRLIKSSGASEIFDLQAFLDGNTLTKLPQIQAGDIIYVPLKTDVNEKSWLDISTKHAIRIMGGVGRPGRYSWSNDMNLLDLISYVGGTTKDADTTHVRIINNENGPPLDFNLKEAMEKGVGPAGLPTLKAGYTVYVPELSLSPFDMTKAIKVFGEVFKPGTYTYNPKYTVIDYILQAGSITMHASADQIKIIDNNKAVLFNLKDYLDTGKMTNMPSISPGATIFVPVVTPSEVKTGARTVYLMGNVQKPGAYELGKNATFMDALANAGGPSATADTRKLRLIRASGVVELFDLQSFIEGRSSHKLPVLQAGDVIYIPLKLDQNEKSWLDISPNRAIRIMGGVGRPGRYSWSNEMSLLDLISYVGGTTKDADTAHVRIINNENGPPLDFNLKEAMEKGVGPAGLPTLKAGYTVYVPELSLTPFDMTKAIKVFGEVFKPGSYTYNPKYTAIDYILQAGSITMHASTDQIKILDNNTAVLFNLKDYLDTGNMKNMPAISPGATIFVPVVAPAEVKKGKRTVYAMGQVQRTGAFELGKNATFMDALANAGGPSVNADTRKVRVIKPDGSFEHFDLNAYTDSAEGLDKAKLPPLPTLGSGDVIYIPMKADWSGKSWIELPPNHAVKVIGAVGRPGRYEWSNEMSLLDLLAQAGGPNNEADTAHINITTDERTKGGATTIEFNLQKFIEKGGDLSTIPEIKAGYTIDVPHLPISHVDNKSIWTELPAKNSIYVFGEVNSPGRYNFNSQLSFLDILSAANGPTANADLHDIHVIDRQGIYPQVVHVNLSLYFETGDPELLPKVLPGDAIYITQVSKDYTEVNTRHVIKILGDVAKPGRYRYTSNMTIIDLLAAAGGPSGTALVSKILVVNVGPRLETRTSTFDLMKFSKTGNVMMLPTLREGDIVYVPNNQEDIQVRMATILQNITNSLAILTLATGLKSSVGSAF